MLKSSHQLCTHRHTHTQCECIPGLWFPLTSCMCCSVNRLQCQSAEMPVCSRWQEPELLYPAILVFSFSCFLQGERLRETHRQSERWRGTDKEKGHRQKQVASMVTDTGSQKNTNSWWIVWLVLLEKWGQNPPRTFAFLYNIIIIIYTGSNQIHWWFNNYGLWATSPPN